MINDLNLLYVFYTVSKYENMSKASIKLYISQPACSQNIKTLEEQVGFPLFIRHAKGVSLTNEGKEIYNICKEIFLNVDILNRKIDDLSSLDSGTLRIGASDTICKYYLIDKLKSFEKLFPKIRYRVTNCTTNESLRLLKENKVDIAFIHTPIKCDASIYNCLSLHDCFVCAKDFDSSKINTLSDLANYRILLLETDSHSRKMLDINLSKYNVELKPKFELASLDILIEFCKKNMGIICVSKEYIQKELDNNELKVIDIKENLEERFISLAINNKNYLSNAAKRFVEHIKK